jgi:hypothetical protein
MANAWPAEPIRSDHYKTISISVSSESSLIAYLSSKLLGEGHEANSSHDYLHNAVNSSREETSRSASQPDLLKDLGREIVYRICP